MAYDVGPLYRYTETVELAAPEREVALWYFGPRAGAVGAAV